MYGNDVYFPGPADYEHCFQGIVLSRISYDDLATEDLPRYATTNNVQIEVFHKYSCSIRLNIECVHHMVHTCPYIFNIQQYRKVQILV